MPTQTSSGIGSTIIRFFAVWFMTGLMALLLRAASLIISGENVLQAMGITLGVAIIITALGVGQPSPNQVWSSKTFTQTSIRVSTAVEPKLVRDAMNRLANGDRAPTVQEIADEINANQDEPLVYIGLDEGVETLMLLTEDDDLSDPSWQEGEPS